MDKNQWEKVNRIVDTALDLDGKERDTYIQQQCRGDKELKNQVTQLLQSIEESGTEGFLEDPEAYPGHLAAGVTNIIDEDAETSLTDKQIDNYRILELIGHGGMGSVYLAERADEMYQQKVAFKVMRQGMDTPSNIARFKRERNILANLNHPGIAKLLDGGVTNDGLPYLVMEYVEGTPLYNYCDKNRLSIQERLTLFKSICEAVQHAHQNAIIHRDLKPSNILVTNQNQIKILDFGIAKLLEPKNPEQTLYQTQTGARLLTLGYAAPEQVKAKSVTTATDTYALGVLLYELLANSHPHNLEDKNLNEIEQVIRKQIPPIPSEKFRELPQKQQKRAANHRSSDPSSLINILQGDLDAIVIKALRKEPEARYGSAEKMLDDLDRREQNRPITAREDTFRYKSSRFIKRHKTGLGMTAGFLLLVLVFIGFYTWQITEERSKAQQEAEKAQQISNFLVNIFEAGNPNVAEGDTLTARELLNSGLQKIDQLENRSIKAKMLTILGQSYTGLGDYETASDLYGRAIKLSKQAETEDSRIVYANAVSGLGTLHSLQQNFEEALPYLKRAYSIQSQELGDSDPQTIHSLSNIGVALRNTGELDSAEFYVRKALNIHRNNSTILSDSLLQKIKKDLAYILREKEEYREAERLYKEVISENETETPANQSDLVQLYNNLAFLYKEQEQYDNAETYYDKALNLSSRIRGKSHPITNMIRSNFATTLIDNNKLNEAEYLFKENIKQTKERYSENHWRTGKAHTTVGYLLILEMEEYEKAKNYIREGIQIYENNLGPDHTWTGYAKGLLTAAEYLTDNRQVSDSLFTVHHEIFEQHINSLDGTNKGQIENLIDIYTTETDTINKSYVSAYQELLVNS